MDTLPKSTIQKRVSKGLQQFPALALASLCLASLMAGCLEGPKEEVYDGPPRAVDIFTNPPSGASFPYAPIKIYLDPSLLDAPELGKGGWANLPIVCYTTNGLDPLWSDASCFGNEGVPYSTVININCDGQEGDVTRTVKVLYQWNDDSEDSPLEVIEEATYSMVCRDLPADAVKFTVTLAGNVEAISNGKLKHYAVGAGVFDPSNGTILYNAFIDAQTAGAFATWSQTQATLSLQGSWDPDTGILSNVTGTSETTKCTDKYPDAFTPNPCSFIVGYIPSNAKFDGSTVPFELVTDNRNTPTDRNINFNTAPGGITEFTQYYIANPGDLILEAFSWTNFVLSNEL